METVQTENLIHVFDMSRNVSGINLPKIHVECTLDIGSPHNDYRDWILVQYSFDTVRLLNYIYGRQYGCWACINM